MTRHQARCLMIKKEVVVTPEAPKPAASVVAPPQPNFDFLKQFTSNKNFLPGQIPNVGALKLGNVAWLANEAAVSTTSEAPSGTALPTLTKSDDNPNNTSRSRDSPSDSSGSGSGCSGHKK